jgi:hypothetical protein
LFSCWCRFEFSIAGFCSCVGLNLAFVFLGFLAFLPFSFLLCIFLTYNMETVRRLLRCVEFFVCLGGWFWWIDVFSRIFEGVQKFSSVCWKQFHLMFFFRYGVLVRGISQPIKSSLDHARCIRYRTFNKLWME